MPELSRILQRGHAQLLRYLVPYNPGQSRAALEEAAALLLARLLFVRSLEVRGIEQPQLAPLLSGWQRIGRRRDLLGLLAGLSKMLQRLYAGPLLVPAPLDRLECEPTPLEPLVEALLDQALAPLLGSPLALARAWEAAFAPQRCDYADELVALLWQQLDLAGRSELPAVLDLRAGAGLLLAQAALSLRGAASGAGKRRAELASPSELLARLRGVEPAAVLRWGATLSICLALLSARARLPQLAPLLAEPPARRADIVVLRLSSPQEACELLDLAQHLLADGGTLGCLLPPDAAERPEWESARRQLFERWSLQSLQQQPSGLLLAARPEPEPRQRASAQISLAPAGRGTVARISQGTLQTLAGAPLRAGLSEAGAQALIKLRAGPPLSSAALVWRVKAGAPRPERGASAVRAGLPKLVLRLGEPQQPWLLSLIEDWPEAGGLVVQPLALLAQHRGAGVRLDAQQLAATEPYSLELLAAVLSSQLLRLYWRLVVGGTGAPSADQLRLLPLPAPQGLAPGAPPWAAGAPAERQREQQLAALYGLGASEWRAVATLLPTPDG